MIFSKKQTEHQSGDGLSRLSVKYEDLSKRFHFQAKKDYTRQFAHIYVARLNEMRALIIQSVFDKWADKYPLKQMGDFREEEPEKCILVGTLVVYQKLKPSILRDISEETQLLPQPVRSHFVDESDQLVLEDELQRIRLFGNVKPHEFVTGIVCAVLGRADDHGKFFVEDSVFYECGPQRPLKSLDSSPLLVLISGLDQSSTSNFALSLELLRQWIYGNLMGIQNSIDIEAANIVRIIVAGNTVRATTGRRHKTISMRQPESILTLEAIKVADELMAELTKSVNVDLMSGEFDSSNFLMPQQPMHHCMFPLSAKHTLFKCTTNPYECMIENRVVLGTSGQNIDDIQKYSNIEDPLEALRSIARWGHLAPTSPDTLACYPYYKEDPFIIRNCPHILFAGNTNEFKTELYSGLHEQRIRLVCVPSFSQSQSIAVVNLQTLDCKQVNFHIDGLGA